MSEQIDFTRDPMAVAMLAAWLNVEPDQIPAGNTTHTNQATMAAWKRVGEAAMAFMHIKSKRSPAELLADLVHQAKILERVRSGMLFVAALEDEGDRVYFGSSNHADHFRDLFKDLEEWDLERAAFPATGRDLYADLRRLRDTIRTMTDALKGAVGSLEYDIDAGADQGDAEWEGKARQHLDAVKAAIALGEAA